MGIHLLSLISLLAVAGLSTIAADFNVKSYGAKGDGRTDDTNAFTDAWKATCAAAASGAVKLWIPNGVYFVGPLKFYGPCKNSQFITVQLDGSLSASTDLSKYGDSWVEFGWLDNLVLTGSGTLDGNGQSSWHLDQCPKTKNCKVLPVSLKFVNMKNTQVIGIKSVNPKFFHMAVLDCNGFKASGLTISAPQTSPNTDGMHIERSSNVLVHHSNIGTGDDCISIGHTVTNVEINNVHCGPGHGISVGSLGRYQGEGDVTGVVVKDSNLAGTDNGVRIKTWENSPGASRAHNFTFDNIIMTDVLNPIIIDQTYCPYAHCDTSAPSRVALRDITFNNIRGTSKSTVAVLLDCSRGNPCQNVQLHDVNIHLSGGGGATATCNNVKAIYGGVQNPPPCS